MKPRVLTLMSVAFFAAFFGFSNVSAQNSEHAKQNSRALHPKPHTILLDPRLYSRSGPITSRTTAAKPSLKDHEEKENALLPKYSLNDVNPEGQNRDIPRSFHSAPLKIYSGESISPSITGSPYYIPSGVELLRF